MGTDESLDTSLINESLQKVAKGAGLVFIGTLLSLFLSFIGKVVIARYWAQSDYGVFSLSLVLLNICVIISTLGLREGVSRSIAYTRGKNENKKIPEIISISIYFSIISSIFLSLFLFLTSEIIAKNIFHEPALVSPLRIFSTAIPFFTLVYVMVSIFRGFNQIKPTVYFQLILRNTIFPLILAGIIFLNLSFISVFYAYVISLIITFTLLVIYAIKRFPPSIKLTKISITSPIAKELLFFSLPLLGVAMFQMIISWTDTLMLGSFKNAADVGLYNAALPLAYFISSPLNAMLLVYMPIASGLYAKDMLSEIRRNFSVLTKWLCSATFPLFLILFLFPEAILNFLFGHNYIFAAGALRILSLGFIISNFLGPNGATLIAMGKTHFMMWATLATAIINIALNAILIPFLGIVGASIASITALTSINIVRCWKLYSISKVHSLSKNLIKPAFVSGGVMFIIYIVSKNFFTTKFWMLPILFIIYYIIYGLAILFTKSFDIEDIEMLLLIEKKVGVNLRIIKKALERFV